MAGSASFTYYRKLPLRAKFKMGLNIITLSIFLCVFDHYHLKDGEDPLTSVTIDENFLLPRCMCVIILVTNCHRQGAGHCSGWTATVTHDNRNEELFLALAIKCPQSC